MAHDPFVEQLAELCGAEPTRAKWVFVPDHVLGLTLGERLAREGCDWANLRFVTPLDIAVRMAAPFLIDQGINPSEEPLGPALMMSLLLDLPEEGGYFRPMAEHPTMAEALWRTVRELRYSGAGAADLSASAFTSAAKHTELGDRDSGHTVVSARQTVPRWPAGEETASANRGAGRRARASAGCAAGHAFGARSRQGEDRCRTPLLPAGARGRAGAAVRRLARRVPRGRPRRGSGRGVPPHPRVWRAA